MALPKVVIVQPHSFHTWLALSAAYLVAYAKAHCRMRDISFFSQFYDDDKTILDACKDADVIGFTATSPQWKHARELGRKIKAINPNAWIVAGGFHPSNCAEDCLAEGWVDAVVKGEGEIAFADIVNGCRDRILERPQIQDLDTIPFPDRVTCRQETQFKRTTSLWKSKIADIFTNRGCPYRCRFCASRSVWGTKQRIRSPQNILDEFTEIRDRWNADYVGFADDEFGIYRKETLEFLEAKIRWDPKFPWGCNVVASTVITWDGKVSPFYLSKFKEAGCTAIWIGVESGSPQVMAETKKPITVEKVKTCFKMARDVGLERRAYMLLGMPNETEETIAETEAFVDEIQPDVIGFTILCPFPGSDYYVPEKHRLIDWDRADEYGNDFWSTPALSNERLRFHQRRLTEKYSKQATWHMKEAEKLNPLNPVDPYREMQTVTIKSNPGRSGI